MTTTSTDTALDALDAINAGLTGGARSAFGKDVAIGTSISGEIIAADHRQRRDRDTGEPLYWVNKKLTTDPVGDPAMEDILTIETTEQLDDADEGLRRLWLDQPVKAALRSAMRAAGAVRMQLGDRIEGLALVNIDTATKKRVYEMAAYVPKTAGKVKAAL